MAIIAANNKTSPDADSSLKKYLNGFDIYCIIGIIYLFNVHLSIAKKSYLTYKNSHSGRSAAW